MIPLWTTATSPLVSVCGCALTSLAGPWVAQRVWPMPALAGEPLGQVLGQVAHPAGLLGDLDAAAAEHGDAGRVVAAVLEPGQPLQQQRARPAGRRCSRRFRTCQCLPSQFGGRRGVRAAVAISRRRCGAAAARAELGSGDHAVGQLLGDPGEDLVVLRAVGLEVRVPASDVLLHGLGVEGDHVLDHPRRLGRGEAGAGDDPLDESGIGGGHGGMVPCGPRLRNFLPDSGQDRAQFVRRPVVCSRVSTSTRRLFTRLRGRDGPGRARAAVPRGPRLGWAATSVASGRVGRGDGPRCHVQRASMWVRPRASTTGTHRMVSPADVCDSLMRHLLFMFCSPRLPLPHPMRETTAEYGEFAPFRARSTARRPVAAPRASQLTVAAAPSCDAQPRRASHRRVNKRQVGAPTREQTTGRVTHLTRDPE